MPMDSTKDIGIMPGSLEQQQKRVIATTNPARNSPQQRSVPQQKSNFFGHQKSCVSFSGVVGRLARPRVSFRTIARVDGWFVIERSRDKNTGQFFLLPLPTNFVLA